MYRGFRPGERINPLLDTDKDGAIAFAEADPIIAGWYADTPGGGLDMAATGRALPGLAEAWTPALPPLLLLHGVNDAMVDPDDTTAFASRVRDRARVELATYRGLGHSLGRAPSVTEDRLAPMDAAPLDALARWLRRTLARAR